jgi:hypothetical protein
MNSTRRTALVVVLILSFGVGCGGNAQKGVNSNLDKPKPAKRDQ